MTTYQKSWCQRLHGARGRQRFRHCGRRQPAPEPRKRSRPRSIRSWLLLSNKGPSLWSQFYRPRFRPRCRRHAEARWGLGEIPVAEFETLSLLFRRVGDIRGRQIALPVERVEFIQRTLAPFAVER